MNLDHTAVIKKGVPALERGRLSHVTQNYLGAEAYARANAPLIEAQADIGFARALGGGLCAAVDGMRFVVPAPSIYARPNRKYFGAERGVTWLNVISDRGIGLAGKVFSGTPRDSLHMIDVVYNQDGGQRPDIIVSDAGSYSDLVFGLVHLCWTWNTARPWPTCPATRVGESTPRATTGRWNTFARGLIDRHKIRSRWEEILQVVVSIHTSPPPTPRHPGSLHRALPSEPPRAVIDGSDKTRSDAASGRGAHDRGAPNRHCAWISSPTARPHP